MGTLKVIHYGASSYNENLFKSIVNSKGWIKPKQGGLWTSPVNSIYGWKDWNLDSEYADLSENFILDIKYNNVCLIDSYIDFSKILKDYNIYSKYIDYEKLASDFDCMHLTYKGMRETSYIETIDKPNLYGFDCETVFIFNSEIIINS